MANIKIIQAAPNDLELLQKISRETFMETFAEMNSEENMKKYLEESFSREKMSNELSNVNSVFYFILQDERTIGYLKLNFGPAQTELKDDNAMEIERIYILKEFHGKDAGLTLLEKALYMADKKKKDYVWLAVWEQNPRAIQFYRKNGFIEFGKHIFRLGNDEQTDIMMKLVINDGK